MSSLMWEENVKDKGSKTKKSNEAVATAIYTQRCTGGHHQIPREDLHSNWQHQRLALQNWREK